MEFVGMDHGYSKPWSAHPEATNARPIKTIYMKRPHKAHSQEHTK